jgi:hypothetical protein
LKSRWQRLLPLGTLSALVLLGTTVSASPADAAPPPGVVLIPIENQARVAITSRYNQTSPYNMAAALGPATNSVTMLDTYVAYQRFQRGAIYWSSNIGAQAVMGDIYTRWQQLGGWSGYGLPVTSETGTPDGVGRYNHFTGGGSIYWSPSTGAHEVYGDIRTRWAAMGWERVGYPTTGETGTPDGVGRFNHFGGLSIYWTGNTGAHEVHGSIRDKWAATGWENGVGYPTTDESGTPDGVGRFNHFTNGSIYWSSTTGAHPVSGAIRDAWSRDGWENGHGYPVTDPVAGSNAVCGTVVQSQRFARLDGTNGWYCQDANGWVRWVVPSTAPPMTTPTTKPPTPPTTRPPTVSTTTTTTTPPAQGTWICSTGGGVPTGLVATQIGTIAGCNGTGMFVIKPTSSMWICAYESTALNGFVIDQMNPSAGVCAFGPQYHIV